MNIFVGMDPLIALSIIGVFIIIVLIVGIVVYKASTSKKQKESSASLPDGTDQSDTARMLQDKYRSERESGDYKRNI